MACTQAESTPTFAPTPRLMLTPTSSPVSLTAAEILALSREQIEKVRTLRTELGGMFQAGYEEQPFKLDAEMALPDRAHGLFELGVQQEFLRIGEENYTTSDGYSFNKNYYYSSGAVFLELLKPLLQPGADEPFTELERQPDETSQGRKFYHITFRMDLVGFIERFAGELTGVEITRQGELFIDQESLLPYRFMVDCKRCPIPLSQDMDLTMNFSLSRFNQPVHIPSPADGPSLLLRQPKSRTPTRKPTRNREGLMTPRVRPQETRPLRPMT